MADQFFTAEVVGSDVVKLVFCEHISGTLQDLISALDPHMQTPKLIMDFSGVSAVDPSVGIGFVQFWQKRGHSGCKTAVFGVSPALKKSAFTTCFMFVETKEWAADEADAIAKVGG